MNIHDPELRLFNEIPNNDGIFNNPVVTIGNFDGVHIGHKTIISTLLKRSLEYRGDPVVITFKNHPRTVIHPDRICRMITTIEEKQTALYNLGIRNIILLEFTKEIANLTARQFYYDLLIKKLKVKEIVIGYDHAFGKNREGNLEYLLLLSKQTGVNITRVNEATYHDQIISSTMLRSEIDQGNMIKVEHLLGRKYTLTGTIVAGVGRGGKKLGYPTANIQPDSPDKVIPGDGVYTVFALLPDNKVYGGMLNIGNNPTFHAEHKTIELNIFDFDKDLYSSIITIEFIKKIRNEIKFQSAEFLIQQLKEDEITARIILNETSA